MSGIQNQETCVDDSILFDNSIEENFFRVCEFLTVGASGGCTFNPHKFQFGQKEVTFLGFLITEDGVKTTPQFRESILNFPPPQNITDIRSWFGCINQVSYAFATAPLMAPFRHLLSAKVPFEWTDELQAAFEASKREILAQCEKGVRSFNPALPTALATDWAKLGLGFWLCQKHCSCPSGNQSIPGCCPSGWQTVYCGSKFCSPAESRYHPIEGEALAATYGLQKCRFFILGLDNLILTLDHKPLLAILGPEQDLEEIENPRLLNFKLKSLVFRFRVIHVPGKKNVTADTFSRRYDSPTTKKKTTPPAQLSAPLPGYDSELRPPSWVSSPTSVTAINTSNDPVLRPIPASLAALLAVPTACEEQLAPEHIMVGYIMSCIAAINGWCRLAPITTTSMPEALSWRKLEAACQLCDTYRVLLTTVQQGTERKEDWDQRIMDFYPHRRSLVAVGPVVLLHDRPVIPQALRQTVLAHLHAGHQGANSMFERAAATLYWPNYRSDIVNYKAACSLCSRYQPSNPAMPPVTPETPLYPFQSICADFFSLKSRTFLALVDRFSNWLSIFQLDQDNSEGLLKVLREYFGIFGIPITFTSDGAKVFTSEAVEEFFDRYGVIHQVTTAYNPRSNKRAEIAVKSAKRLVRDNLSQSGSINTDKLTRALLQHRNTPCAITGLSPAQIIFGRVIRDFLPLQPGKFLPRQEWRQAADTRADAYAKRIMEKATDLSRHARRLHPLKSGQQVLIQDQDKASKTYKQWNRTGVVIEVLAHDAYQIRVDGSRHVTKRNRQYLRPVHTTPDVFTPPKQDTTPLEPQTWTPQQPSKELDAELRPPQMDYSTPKPKPQENLLQTPLRMSVEKPTLTPDNSAPVKPAIDTPIPDSQPTPETTAHDLIPRIRIRRQEDDSWSISSLKPNHAANTPHMITPVRSRCPCSVQHGPSSSSPQYLVYQTTPLHGILPVPSNNTMDSMSTQTSLWPPQSFQCSSFTPQSLQCTSFTPQSLQCVSFTPQPLQCTSFTPQTTQCPNVPYSLPSRSLEDDMTFASPAELRRR